MKTLNTLVLILLAAMRLTSAAQFTQQGTIPYVGGSFAVSADGNTVLAKGGSVFQRTGSTWTQVFTLAHPQPISGGVAISADGNTAVLSGQYFFDGSGPGLAAGGGEGAEVNSAAVDNGSAIVYVRTNGVWTFQSRIVCFGSSWVGNDPSSVAISADGNTVLIGGPNQNYQSGGAWPFTRNATGAWTPQGMLHGTGSNNSKQGTVVALSADGNTALIGAPFGSATGQTGQTGATWVFVRNGSSWTQQAALSGTERPGLTASQGGGRALSYDGNTALIGAAYSDGTGATWVFSRNFGTWTQSDTLVDTAVSGGTTLQVGAVSLSADGNTALIGGSTGIGGGWIFRRSGALWAQMTRLSDAAGSFPPNFVALSADANTAFVAGHASVSVFSDSAHPFGVTAPQTVQAGVSFPVTVAAYNDMGAIDPAYNGRVRFNANQDPTVLPSVYVGTTAGVQTYNVTLLAPVTSILTATDIADPSLTGKSTFISVTPTIFVAPATLPAVTVGSALYNQTFSATGGTGAITFSASGTLPPGMSFDPASRTLSGAPTTIGTFSFTITATDIAGVSGFTVYTVKVDAHHLAVASPGAVTSGTSFAITVSAFDNGSSVVPSYAGQVHFTSSDNIAVLPADYAFVAGDAGAHTFNVTLKKPGISTVSALDLGNPLLSAASRNITVNPAITVNPPSLPSTALGGLPYNQTISTTGGTGPISLSLNDPLPPGITFNPVTGALTGSASAIGTYSFSITATDTVGAAGSINYTIVVNKADAVVTLGNLLQAYDGTPKSASASTFPAGLPVTLTYNGSPTPPVYVGSYTVVGTIDDDHYRGSATGTLTIGGPDVTTITVQPRATPNPVLFNRPTAFSVSAINSNGNPIDYAWDFGDGKQGIGASPSHTYDSTGNYTATVTITSSAAPVSASVQVTVKVPTGTNSIVTGPTANPNPAGINTPVAFSVSAFNTAGDPLTYTWEFGDGATADGQNVSHSYSTSGQFTATITVSGGVAPITRTLQVTITRPPSITTISTGPDANPNPALVATPIAFSVVATNSNNDPLTYTWGFGDGAQATGASVSHSYASAGTYTAVVIVTGGATPVSGAVQVTVTIPSVTTIVTAPTATPNPALTLQDIVFTVAASNSTGALLTYSWDFQGAHATGNPVTYAYSVPGTYTATVTITGGTTPVSASVQVVINPQPPNPTTITAAPSATPNPAEVGQSIAFSVTATNPNNAPLSYTWSFGDGTQATGASVSHAYASIGAYPATVTVLGGDAPVPREY